MQTIASLLLILGITALQNDASVLSNSAFGQAFDKGPETFKTLSPVITKMLTTFHSNILEMTFFQLLVKDRLSTYEFTIIGCQGLEGQLSIFLAFCTPNGKFSGGQSKQMFILLIK